MKKALVMLVAACCLLGQDVVPQHLRAPHRFNPWFAPTGTMACVEGVIVSAEGHAWGKRDGFKTTNSVGCPDGLRAYRWPDGWGVVLTEPLHTEGVDAKLADLGYIEFQYVTDASEGTDSYVRSI